jgi:S1-C subfamily serine protease
MRIYLPAAQRPLFERLVSMTVEVRVEGRNNNLCGSGAVLTADGLIITAYHLITRSRVVRVRRLRLDRKRWHISPYGNYKADVIFRDKRRDIAVLRLRQPPADLAFAELGNSDTAEVGMATYRVGRDAVPLANGHVIKLPAAIAGLLHVSMASTVGASGGPIFDEHSALLGICLKGELDEKMPQMACAIPVATLRKHILRRKAVRAALSENDAKRLL